MKKLFSILLSFAIVLGMGSVVNAALINEQGGNTVPFSKIYKKVGSSAISPAEEFIFTIEPVSVTNSEIKNTGDMPKWPGFTYDETNGDLTGDLTLVFSGSAEEQISQHNLILPTYERTGIYTYKIKETNNEVAGVKYDDNERFIKVTVTDVEGELVPFVSVRTEKLEDDNTLPDPISDGKTDLKFTNTYEAGELAVTKEVTGPLGDKKKYFKVYVTLTAPDSKNVNSTIGIIPGSYPENPDTIAVGVKTEFWLKNGDSIKFTNLPYGVGYNVEEDDYYHKNEGYEEPVYKDAQGVIESASVNAKITNEKKGEVDTGISLDSIPYIMILGLAVLGISGLFLRKRKNANF